MFLQTCLAVNISRAASRLKSVFLSMTGGGQTGATADNIKEFNIFWCAMLGSPDSDKEMEFQVQIGHSVEILLLQQQFLQQPLQYLVAQMDLLLFLRGNLELNILKEMWYSIAL